MKVQVEVDLSSATFETNIELVQMCNIMQVSKVDTALVQEGIWPQEL